MRPTTSQARAEKPGGLRPLLAWIDRVYLLSVASQVGAVMGLLTVLLENRARWLGLSLAAACPVVTLAVAARRLRAEAASTDALVANYDPVEDDDDDLVPMERALREVSGDPSVRLMVRSSADAMLTTHATTDGPVVDVTTAFRTRYHDDPGAFLAAIAHEAAHVRHGDVAWLRRLRALLHGALAVVGSYGVIAAITIALVSRERSGEALVAALALLVSLGSSAAAVAMTWSVVRVGRELEADRVASEVTSPADLARLLGRQLKEERRRPRASRVARWRRLLIEPSLAWRASLSWSRGDIGWSLIVFAAVGLVGAQGSFLVLARVLAQRINVDNTALWVGLSLATLTCVAPARYLLFWFADRFEDGRLFAARSLRAAGGSVLGFTVLNTLDLLAQQVGAGSARSGKLAMIPLFAVLQATLFATVCGVEVSIAVVARRNAIERAAESPSLRRGLLTAAWLVPACLLAAIVLAVLIAFALRLALGVDLSPEARIGLCSALFPLSTWGAAVVARGLRARSPRSLVDG